MTAGVDCTRLVERLAAQYADAAMWHPVAAAVAIACRGHTSLDLVAFARTFAGTADIVPSPKPARASRRAVRFALAAFGLGLASTLTLQVLALTGVANAWIR